MHAGHDNVLSRTHGRNGPPPEERLGDDGHVHEAHRAMGRDRLISMGGRSQEVQQRER